jgi:hypothetical protein
MSRDSERKNHMPYSAPSLHASVLTLQEHTNLLAGKLASIAAARQRQPAEVSSTLAPVVSIDIPLTTVSLQNNFDASIDITYRGAHAGFVVPLLVDSGNSSLIIPKYAAISALPNFARNYTVLAQNVTEPWGCPAHIVRGPIQIPTRTGGTYEIPNCVFYACTGPNPKGELTANFGTGCISPWQTVGSIKIQSPLSFDASFPFAEFNYAPADQVLTRASQPNIAQGSLLTLYRTMPQGYRTFNILKNCFWMSVIPQSLSIGNTQTAWPGARPSIAMVDTGGGPVFLSDPDGYVYQGTWPDPVANPWWTSPDSVSCQSTDDKITIGLGDGTGSFSYPIDTSLLPESVRGLTLVMCEKCAYMMDNNGMNIGGITALFNYILIDYASAKVGFKTKMAPSA